jgi:hypothetical protein
MTWRWRSTGAELLLEGAGWAPASVAAAAWRISTRALRRRVKRGEIRFRHVVGDRVVFELPPGATP